MSLSRQKRIGTGLWSRLIARLRGRDLEAEYKAWLRQYGRLTDGRVLDFQQEAEEEVTIFYCYSLANVRYETSFRLTPAQVERKHKYIPGASITVRYDPKMPGSSMVE